MTLADQYAKALHDVAAKHPERAGAYLKNLHGALKRRGHEKLLPRILEAYEILEESGKRRARIAEVSPDRRRTRTLVELYKKLITS